MPLKTRKTRSLKEIANRFDLGEIGPPVFRFFRFFQIFKMSISRQPLVDRARGPPHLLYLAEIKQMRPFSARMDAWLSRYGQKLFSGFPSFKIVFGRKKHVPGVSGAREYFYLLIWAILRYRSTTILAEKFGRNLVDFHLGEKKVAAPTFFEKIEKKIFEKFFDPDRFFEKILTRMTFFHPDRFFDPKSIFEKIEKFLVFRGRTRVFEKNPKWPFSEVDISATIKSFGPKLVSSKRENLGLFKDTIFGPKLFLFAEISTSRNRDFKKPKTAHETQIFRKIDF